MDEKAATPTTTTQKSPLAPAASIGGIITLILLAGRRLS